VGRKSSQLTIPSTTLKLSAVREFVEKHAKDCGFSADVVDQMSLAVDEACTNVIRHAYRGSEAGPVDIRIVVDSNRFTVTIRDQGDSVDFDHYKRPNLAESIRARRGGGFGVDIMRRLMDLVEYERRGRFNEVHLTKFRDGDSNRSLKL
jgi:serine/threonine-protein kinase RsbW